MANHKARSYFLFHSLSVKYCRMTNKHHYAIEKHCHARFSDFLETREMHQSSILSYIQALTDAGNKAFISLSGCWRNTGDSTTNRSSSNAPVEQPCHADEHFEYRAILSIPVVLMLEMNPHEPSWDCPATMQLLSGVEYELTSRVFFQGTVNYEGNGSGHYISRHARNTPGEFPGHLVYDYDDLQGGYLRKLQGGTIADSLAGENSSLKPPVPLGFGTAAVVYCLKGGRAAQQRFYDERKRVVEQFDPSPRVLSTSVEDVAVSAIELRSGDIQVVSRDKRAAWYPPGQRLDMIESWVEYDTIQHPVDDESSLASDLSLMHSGLVSCQTERSSGVSDITSEEQGHLQDETSNEESHEACDHSHPVQKPLHVTFKCPDTMQHQLKGQETDGSRQPVIESKSDEEAGQQTSSIERGDH